MSSPNLKYTISRPVNQSALGTSISVDETSSKQKSNLVNESDPNGQDNIFNRRESLQENESDITSMNVSDMDLNPVMSNNINTTENKPNSNLFKKNKPDEVYKGLLCTLKS